MFSSLDCVLSPMGLFPFLLTLAVLTSGGCSCLDDKDNDGDTSDGLVLLHVIHRHGGRIRDEETYPNDPYINETFYPYGYAQLTKTGRQMMYIVGNDLRARYDDFLGELYNINVIEPFSTDINRTKMSILLTLAALYPSSDTDMDWNHKLNWQPIPYNYGNDHVVGDSMYFCPKYRKLYQEYLESEDGLQVFKEDLDLYSYCSKHTGWNITKPEEIYKLYKILISEYEYGLELPEWTRLVWKTPLFNAAVKRFIVRTGTNQLKRLSGGWFIKKIIDDTINKINGSLVPRERKFFLYSGHETNIGFILRTLGLFDNQIPNYGSQVIFEVRLHNGVYGIEIWHRNYMWERNSAKLLTLPNCTSFCPIDQFVQLLDDVIPKDFSECEL